MSRLIEEYREKRRLEGLEQGRLEVKREGYLEGANKEKRSVISLMLTAGQTPQQINQMLHYPIELIQEVQATM